MNAAPNMTVAAKNQAASPATATIRVHSSRPRGLSGSQETLAVRQSSTRRATSPAANSARMDSWAHAGYAMNG